jgi:pimeloyl-ACP methyl ester carboxylesterase
MMPSDFTLHRFATLDGAELVWHEAGAGRAVILLHGLFSDARTNWIRYGHAKLLVNNGFKVILPDLRAHGSSAKSRAFGPDRL